MQEFDELVFLLEMIRMDLLNDREFRSIGMFVRGNLIDVGRGSRPVENERPFEQFAAGRFSLISIVETNF